MSCLVDELSCSRSGSPFHMMLEPSKGPIRNCESLRVHIGNRAKFNQYALSACCLLCGTHFIAECPRLGCTRDRFMNNLKAFLIRTNPNGLVDNYLSVSEQLVELLLDCSSDGPRAQLCVDKDIVSSIESLSRNLCYSLHQQRCELTGLHTMK